MEVIGDDKRIRALYSEVRVADEQAAPSFVAVWHRAQAASGQSRRSFKFVPVTAAAAVVLFGVAALAVWSTISHSSPRANAASATLIATTNFSAVKVIERSEPVTVSPAEARAAVPRRVRPRVQRNLDVAVAENRRLEKQAKEIASWQSPTASLLNSSSDNLFKSLPQLNENANEMKSFLPSRANDKEN